MWMVGFTVVEIRNNAQVLWVFFFFLNFFKPLIYRFLSTYRIYKQTKVVKITTTIFFNPYYILVIHLIRRNKFRIITNWFHPEDVGVNPRRLQARRVSSRVRERYKIRRK